MLETPLETGSGFLEYPATPIGFMGACKNVICPQCGQAALRFISCASHSMGPRQCLHWIVVIISLMAHPMRAKARQPYMQSGLIILHLSRPELGRLDTYFWDTSYFSLRSRNTFCCCINRENRTSCKFNFALVRATGKLSIFIGVAARNLTRAHLGAAGCIWLQGRSVPPVECAGRTFPLPKQIS